MVGRNGKLLFNGLAANDEIHVYYAKAIKSQHGGIRSGALANFIDHCQTACQAKLSDEDECSKSCLWFYAS